LAAATQPSLRSLLIAIGLFILTGISTLAAGAQFAGAYAMGRQPVLDDFAVSYFQPFSSHACSIGHPFCRDVVGHFAGARIGTLLARRYYRIRPPTSSRRPLIGTLGAFIRIRSPINRRALFDAAIAGPLVGFLVAVPALTIAIAKSIHLRRWR
jgi:hypothetical protein